MKRKQTLVKAFNGLAAVTFESARGFLNFSNVAYGSNTNTGITRAGISAVQRRRKTTKTGGKNDEQH